MKKRLIITSALMTCLLGASLATGTYAWYQAGNATVKSTQATGTVSSTVTSISLDDLTIIFTIGETSVQLSNYNTTSQKLEYGVFHSSGNNTVKDVTAAGVGSFVDTVSITAAWGNAPTGDTLTAIKGKTITGASIVGEGYAKLRSSATDLTGADVASVDLTVTVSDDGLSLTVAATSGNNIFTRVQAKETSSTATTADLESDHNADQFKIAAVDSLTVA